MHFQLSNGCSSVVTLRTLVWPLIRVVSLNVALQVGLLCRLDSSKVLISNRCYVSQETVAVICLHLPLQVTGFTNCFCNASRRCESEYVVQNLRWYGSNERRTSIYEAFQQNEFAGGLSVFPLKWHSCKMNTCKVSRPYGCARALSIHLFG